MISAIIIIVAIAVIVKIRLDHEKKCRECKYKLFSRI